MHGGHRAWQVSPSPMSRPCPPSLVPAQNVCQAVPRYGSLIWMQSQLATQCQSASECRSQPVCQSAANLSQRQSQYNPGPALSQHASPYSVTRTPCRCPCCRRPHPAAGPVRPREMRAWLGLQPQLRRIRRYSLPHIHLHLAAGLVFPNPAPVGFFCTGTGLPHAAALYSHNTGRVYSNPIVNTPLPLGYSGSSGVNCRL